MLRTYKSALAARMGEHLPSNHAIMYWLSEHAASTYNKCLVQADGKTPYEFLHGKAPGLRLIELGKKIMWHVPKKLRVKLDLWWRIGISLGPSQSSNECFIGLPNGNAVRTRSVNRVVQSGKWNAKMILGVKGKHTVIHQDLDFEAVEASEQPHRSDAEHQQDEAAAGPLSEEDRAKEEIKKQAPVLKRQIRITKADLEKFGYEDGCPRCEDLQSGKHQSKREHSDSCRLRMCCHFQGTNDPAL